MPPESVQCGILRHDIAASNRSTDMPPPATNGAANESPSESPDATRRFAAGLPNLSDDQVIRQVVQLNQKQHLVNVELLLYLSELDCRKLYRNHACSSLFDYLTARLGQSEDIAYRWMWGARLLRAFPLVHELLADGRLHLSALMLLKPRLTEENHHAFLMAAAGRSKREVEKLVAARFPKPDVPTRVRKLPEFAPSHDGDSRERPFAEDTGSPGVQSLTATQSVPSMQSVPATSPVPSAPSNIESLVPFASKPSALSTSNPSVPSAPSTSKSSASKSSASKSSHAVDTQPSLQGPPSPRPEMPSRTTKIQPLSEHSYRVVFTASQRLKEKLDRAGELVSHAIAPTDLPALLERALDLLIEREERRRYGSSRQGTASVPSSKDAASRAITTSQRNEDESIAKPARNEQEPIAKPAEPGSLGSVASLSPDTTSTVLVSANRSVTKTAIDADMRAHATRSRYVPAQVRRQVWERDAGQCSYVDREGRRCQSRHRLEFDHRVAFALGGAPTVDNIRLRCAAHNALAAEQVFGLERIAAAITATREHRHRTGTTPGA